MELLESDKLKVVSNLKKKLAKTHNAFVKSFSEAFRICGKIDKNLMESIEDILIQTDFGISITAKIMEKLEEIVRFQKISDSNKIYETLENLIKDILQDEYNDIQKIDFSPNQKPFIILFVGVNGVGKTTTIAKMAYRYKTNGKKVLLVAGDTFRAAAIEQLKIWADRLKIKMSSGDYGSDPSSVIFNALNLAVAKNFDVVLIDTAGRLHTKINLMRELEKISRTTKKVIHGTPHETILIIDSTTGQNGIQQAKTFAETIPISGIILTKLDGTAKGGVAIGIKDSLNIPVRAICIGEKMEDIRDFNSDDFVQAIFG
ncbi:MAG: signal recognition particle-docking protein FtsY [Candidatus Cloacimonetes bacterium]|nr:signal recognition particle-docking protein FtsY [Candidatus Cloacimonadota bacterium]